jgi:pimeloyl-ACP methyl ester carboxylesterase
MKIVDVWLVHGLGDSPRVWRDVRQDLARRGYNVITPALPGFGGAPPLTTRRQGVEELVSWLVAEIRRRSGDRQILVVGHSMGGIIGTLVASRVSEIGGLINIEGPLMLVDCFTSRSAAESRDFPRWFRGFKRAMRAPGSGAPSHYADSVDEADGPSFRACAKDIVELSRRAQMGKLYAALRVPHIFFHGARPGGMSKRSLAFLKTRRCETKEFAGAAHWPMTETPREFTKMLLHTLERFV